MLGVRVSVYELGAANREVDDGGVAIFDFIGVKPAASVADPADLRYVMPAPVLPVTEGGAMRVGGLPGALVARATPSMRGMDPAVSDVLRDETMERSDPSPFLPMDPVAGAGGRGGVTGSAGATIIALTPPLNVRLRGIVDWGIRLLVLMGVEMSGGIAGFPFVLPVLPERALTALEAADAAAAMFPELFDRLPPGRGRPLFLGVVAPFCRLGELGRANVPARGLSRPPAATTVGKVSIWRPRGAGFFNPSGFLVSDPGVAGGAPGTCRMAVG